MNASIPTMQQVIEGIERARDAYRATGELANDRDRREAICLAALDVSEGAAHLVAMCDAAGVKHAQDHAREALAQLGSVLAELSVPALGEHP